GSAKDKAELIRRLSVLDNFLKEGQDFYSGADVKKLVKQSEQDLLEYKKALTILTGALANWKAIDDDANKLLLSIFNLYDQAIQQLREQNDIEDMNTALDVSNKWYALTTEINNYVTKKEKIPTELVTTRFQAVID
ncbi:hypothetical protein ACTVFP_23530, partial [Escherichia coli]|uniref:hypothetical protein n=1 Tax=Escherichia coli TaxID=562 RepID=UPI003FA52593